MVHAVDMHPVARYEPRPMTRTRLSQYWHPVAVAAELGDGPVRVTLLGGHVVLFRSDGQIRAFKDLCIHRGSALSLGTVRDGRIVCAYHGWEYDGTGACVRIPALPRDHAIPARARAVTYQVAEAYGLVWVALEEPVAPIPRMPGDVHLDPAYTSEVFSVVDWNTSAGRSTENSMDVSHFPFVHANLLGDPNHPEQEPYELHEEEWGLWFRVENQFWRASDGSFEGRVDYDYMQVFPFTMHLGFGEEENVTLVSVFASPVDAIHTRVFRVVHRNHPTDRAKFVSEYLLILEQDRLVVESVRPEEIPADLRDELHIKVPDLASIAYRRWLSSVDTMGLAPP
jgi:phenylpropionate dioxygenase-like ring-hydroxylating dioxygenase large terminal subunit